MKNRVLSLLLCILMCLSMFPASAFAEGESYYVYFWYTSPLTLDESGYPDFLPVGEAMLIDESSDYVIGQVPGSILQGLRSYAQSQNLQDHCIVSWTVRETGEAFDFANRRVNELASEDHTLNLLATWGTENSHSYGNWYTTLLPVQRRTPAISAELRRASRFRRHTGSIRYRSKQNLPPARKTEQLHTMSATAAERSSTTRLGVK